MRWSIEELFKAWRIHTEFRFIYKVIKFPINIWKNIKVTFHWIFKGYCKESLWSLDHTLMNVFIQKLTQFQKAGKMGTPMGVTEEEWEDIIARLIKGFKVMKDELILDDLTTSIMKLEDDDVNFNGKSVGGVVSFTRYGKSEDVNMQIYQKQFDYDRATLKLFIRYFRDLWD